MKILILGGSGGLSGTLARMALKQGKEVWTVTRGKRSLPEEYIPSRSTETRKKHLRRRSMTVR